MHQPLSVSVCCTANSVTLRAKAEELAKNFLLPLADTPGAGADFCLDYTPTGLVLRDMTSTTARISPLTVDFVHGAMGYRHSHDRTTRQPLARAVGIRPGFRPMIFDATAGLGGDAFVLAGLGCRVVMSERSPILWALLADGLERASQHPATAKIVADFLELHLGDGQANLALLPERPHTVYLDPMYPHRQQSALNKNAMRFIRRLVGDDQDASALLATARTHATNRVVVKRPKGAPLLGDEQPSHVIVMKNSRFDVYLTIHLC